MSRTALDDAREQLRRRMRESQARRAEAEAAPAPARPELLTTDKTCGSCKHRGEEVIGPSCKKPLGYYHCKLRPHYEWQSPLATCRFEPSKYEGRK